MLSFVAHRGPRAEASLRALQAGVAGAKMAVHAPQLGGPWAERLRGAPSACAPPRENPAPSPLPRSL